MRSATRSSSCVQRFQHDRGAGSKRKAVSKNPPISRYESVVAPEAQTHREVARRYFENDAKHHGPLNPPMRSCAFLRLVPGMLIPGRAWGEEPAAAPRRFFSDDSFWTQPIAAGAETDPRTERWTRLL